DLLEDARDDRPEDDERHRLVEDRGKANNEIANRLFGDGEHGPSREEESNPDTPAGGKPFAVFAFCPRPVQAARESSDGGGGGPAAGGRTVRGGRVLRRSS